jgi:serine protease
MLQNQVTGGGTPIDNVPVARLTASCTELVCNFDAGTSSDDNGVTAYSWNFGDGNSDVGESPSHTYAAAGNYTVTLTVTDTAAQTDNATQAVTVAEAGAGPCPTCSQSSGTLTNGQTVYTDSFNGGAGTYEGYLEGQAGTDFDLALEKFTQSCFIFCSSSWNSVATAETASSSEEINYSGSAGQYRWKITSYSGAGSYDFYSKAP